MKLTRIDHIQLAIPKNGEPRGRQFYGQILGLTEIPKPPPLAARGGVWFKANTFELHLGVQEPFHPATKAHPGIMTDDLDQLARHLQDHGIKVKFDDSLESLRRFFCNDPFGNRLEFLSPRHAK